MGRFIFSPEGSRILFGRMTEQPDGFWEQTLWVLATDGSVCRKVASLMGTPESRSEGRSSEPFLHFAAWDPSGRYVAYDDGKSLFVVDVDSVEQYRISLPDDFSEIALMQWSPDGRQIGIRSSRLQPELWRMENLLEEESEDNSVQ